MVSEVPRQVREGLLRAVAYVVAGEYSKVAALMGDLMLLPQDVVDDPVQHAKLTAALGAVAARVLARPDPAAINGGAAAINGGAAAINGGAAAINGGAAAINGSAASVKGGTPVPALKFDELLGALAGVAPALNLEFRRV